MNKLYLITNDLNIHKYSYINYKYNCKDILCTPSIKKKFYNLLLNIK